MYTLFLQCHVVKNTLLHYCFFGDFAHWVKTTVLWKSRIKDYLNTEKNL